MHAMLIRKLLISKLYSRSTTELCPWISNLGFPVSLHILPTSVLPQPHALSGLRLASHAFQKSKGCGLLDVVLLKWAKLEAVPQVDYQNVVAFYGCYIHIICCLAALSIYIFITTFYHAVLLGVHYKYWFLLVVNKDSLASTMLTTNWLVLLTSSSNATYF